MGRNGNGKNGNGKQPPNDGQQSFSFDEPPVIRPVARRSDPDTSWEAANSFTKKRLSVIQQDVLDYFRTVKRATDEELEDYFREKYQAQTTVSKRRTDLVNLGYLRDSGERAWNRNDRRMIIWELVEENDAAEEVAVPVVRPFVPQLGEAGRHGVVPALRARCLAEEEEEA